MAVASVSGAGAWSQQSRQWGKKEGHEVGQQGLEPAKTDWTLSWPLITHQASNFESRGICRRNWHPSHGAETYPAQESAKLKMLASRDLGCCGPAAVPPQSVGEPAEQWQHSKWHQCLMPGTDLWVYENMAPASLPLPNLTWLSLVVQLTQNYAQKGILEILPAKLSWYSTNPPQSCKRTKYNGKMKY